MSSTPDIVGIAICINIVRSTATIAFFLSRMQCKLVADAVAILATIYTAQTANIIEMATAITVLIGMCTVAGLSWPR